MTVSATTSAGSGSVNYRIYVPYFEGTGPFLAKWEVTSSSDASGTGSYVRLEDDLSNKPDAQSNMSIAIDPSGVVSVVYPYSWGAASNCASGGIKGKLYNSALTLQTTHTPDASYSLGICGVDVAYDAAVSKFKYFYATHARSLGGNDDGVNTVRVATEGGTSSTAMVGNTEGYEQVAARITSGGRYEVNAVGKENNAQPFKIYHSRENGGAPIAFTQCSPGTALSKLHMVEVAKGEDTILGGRCDTGLLLADNMARTTANTNYLKERDISSPVENSNSDITDEAILDDGGTVKVLKAKTSTNTVLDCDSPACTFTNVVYSGPSNTEIQSVRALKASDGALFVVIAIKEKDSTGGKKNKLAIVKRTAPNIYSTASLLNLDAVNVDIQIGRRIAIEGAPGNSNWTNKYTLFASSLDHYGDMTTTADSSTILTPNNLCKGYALGARLPRADSAVAVIAMGGTIAANVGTVDKDVYTNAPTPTLFKYGINFLSDSSGPSFSSYYDETGAAWTSQQHVWLGGTSSSASTFKCIDPGTGNKWSSRADTSDGVFDTLGRTSNDPWINPSTQAARMCDQSAKVLCLIK